jgi:hypothetical protein
METPCRIRSPSLDVRRPTRPPILLETRSHEGDTMRFTYDADSKSAGAVLWTIQAVLALLFLFAGGMKLILPLAALTQQTHVPGAFLRFIGVCEVSGALGLVLPGLLHVREELTPLAARGLVIIMSGAIGATLAAGPVAPALVPLIVGLLAAFVAHARRSGARRRPATGSLLHPAR